MEDGKEGGRGLASNSHSMASYSPAAVSFFHHTHAPP